MMSNKQVFLTLNNNKDQLTSVADITKALLIYAIESPGWTSSYFNGGDISLRSVLAKYEDNSDELIRVFGDNLTTAITRYFPKKGLTVEVSTTPPTDTGAYALNVNVKYPSGISVVTLKDIMILKGKVVSY